MRVTYTPFKTRTRAIGSDLEMTLALIGAIKNPNIEAEDHKEAMCKFFKWIQTKEVWGHLWRINVSIQEVRKIETI